MLATTIVPGDSMTRPSANAYPLSIKNIAPTILSFRHVMGMPPMKELKRHSTYRSLLNRPPL
ncbi:hypothetical protein AWB81_08237 [Caballeronia arationis]|nr:hypothetical protein AWB81_08237 [Caballeronia arationis]